MLDDHPALRKNAFRAIRTLWARRREAAPGELPDIDADLWRLLEAVATGRLPRRAAPFHGPVADRAVSVTLQSRLASTMASMWTTHLVLTRRRDGRFTLKVRQGEDGRTYRVHRTSPFRSAARFLDELLSIEGFEFGEGAPNGAVQDLLPFVALLSPRLADEIAMELVMAAEVEE